MLWISKFFIASLLQLHSSCAEYKIETINITLQHPDHPVYDPRTGYLYFADDSRIYCYDQANASYTWIDVGGRVGPIVPAKTSSSELISGIDNMLVKITWDGKSPMKTQVVYSRVGTNNRTRYNSGKADKLGRLWFATLEEENGVGFDNTGSLRNITRENKYNPSYYVINIWRKIRGFAFTTNNDIVYHANPPEYQILKNYYHINNFTLSDHIICFDLLKQKGNGSADIQLSGVVTDSDNNIWVSLSNGNVYHIDPKTGNILKEISFPVLYLLNLAWGGKNMDILYVTAFSNTVDVSKNVGILYAVTGLGVTGIQTFEADIY